MRLVTLKNAGVPTVGAIVGKNVLNFSAAAAVLTEARELPLSVRGLLEKGQDAVDRARALVDRVAAANSSSLEQLASAGALVPLKPGELLAPIPDPHMVLSCGMNYRKHLAEMGGDMQPTEPYAFLKSVNAIVGPDAPIVLPKLHSDMVDWEAEFSCVIGRRCHRVAAENALEYVAGYTMVNDVSARNWIGPFAELKGLAAVQAWDRNMLGKQFPSFCPMGPAVVTRDEIPDPHNVRFELKLNDTVMQSACTDDLAFDVPAIIAYFSQWHVFQPGDIITTGSPAGVGMARKPRIFLQAGDVVTLSCDAVGSMQNPVRAETSEPA